MCVAQLLINTLWKTTSWAAMSELWGMMVVWQRNICITLSAFSSFVVDDIKCRDQPSHPWKRKQSVQHPIQMDNKMCEKETPERSEAATVDSGAMRCQNWMYIFSFASSHNYLFVTKQKLVFIRHPNQTRPHRLAGKLLFIARRIKHTTMHAIAVASSGMRLSVDEDERCIYYFR